MGGQGCNKASVGFGSVPLTSSSVSTSSLHGNMHTYSQHDKQYCQQTHTHLEAGSASGVISSQCAPQRATAIVASSFIVNSSNDSNSGEPSGGPRGPGSAGCTTQDDDHDAPTS